MGSIHRRFFLKPILLLCVVTLAFLLNASVVLEANAEQIRLYDAHYEGEVEGFSFDTVRSLYQEDETTFGFISVSKRPLAYLREAARVKLLNGVLVPMNYEYKAKILGIRRDHSINFNWIGKYARFERSDKPEKNENIPIVAGFLDPLSMQLEIQRAAIQGLDQVEVSYIRKDSTRNETFRKQPTRETLTLEGKQLQTVMYSSSYRDKETRIYLVPALSYAIGRIVYVDDEGDEAEAKLYKYRVNDEERSRLSRFLSSMNQAIELSQRS